MKVLRFFNAIMTLGRVSNLPSVWSNCLAAWVLSGGQLSSSIEIEKFIWLNLGATFLYLGGMFLNDAFDIEFDNVHRIERPIPSRLISLKSVYVLGGFLMIIGLSCVVWINTAAAIFSLFLAFSIFWYDIIHKKITWSPVIMGLCRFALYLLSGSIALGEINISVVLGGGMLFGYIVGLSNIARKEATGGRVNSWPCWFLFLPLLYSLGLCFLPSGNFQISIGLIVVMLIFILWVSRSLLISFNTKIPNFGRTVSGLLAGIVLFDLLMVSVISTQLFLPFIALFSLSLLLQRFVPAT